MKGVYRTRVGYTGGSLENPNYHNLGDHTEAFQVDYDPAQISYEEILDIFWASHTPTGRVWSRQYMAAVYFHNEEQEKAALASRAAVEEKLGAEVTTAVSALDKFYMAENYHQKYYLQARSELAEELRAYYPDFGDFVNSTAVARVNGYIGGYGDRESLNEELDAYGLSPRGREILKGFVN